MARSTGPILRSRAPLVLAILLLVAFIPVSTPAAGCTGGLSPTVINDTRRVSTLERHECEEIQVRGDLIIDSGGRFQLVNSVLHFAPTVSAARSLTVRAGGEFDASAGARIDGTSTSTVFSIHFQPGSVGNLTQSTIVGHSDLIIDGADVTVSGLTLEQARGSAMTVRSASPRIDGLRVSGGATGVQVEQGSKPVFTGTRVSGTVVYGLHASGNVTVVSESSEWGSSDTGAYLVAAARFIHRNGSFGIARVQARLEPAAGAAPELRLEGTPSDPAKLLLLGDSRLFSGWFIRARVTQDPQAPGMSLDGAFVRLRSAHGIDYAAYTTNATGRGPLLLLPDREMVDGAASSANPWTILVSKGRSAAHATFELVRNRDSTSDEVVVALPLDQDNDAPRWSAGNAGLQAAPYSSNGTLTLRWNPANDDENGTRPNRYVDHYKVYRWTAGASSTIDAARPTLTFTKLLEGNHSFKVQPIDLAGNLGSPSDAIQVFVDLHAPRIKVTANRSNGAVMGHFSGPVRISVNASDALSGIDRVEYSLDQDPRYFPMPAALEVVTEGTHDLRVRAVDRAGGMNLTVQSIVIDREPPRIQTRLLPDAADGREGWYRSKPRILANATDVGASGVHIFRYRLSPSDPWTNTNGTISLARDGLYDVLMEAQDGAGNAIRAVVRVAHDSTPPRLELTADGETTDTSQWNSSPVRLHSLARDDLSGVARLEYRTGSGLWQEFRSPYSIDASGVHNVTVRALDLAGNPSVFESRSISVDLDPPIPPVVEWRPADEGRVRLDWIDGPPLDLHSGIARVVLERADPLGDIQETLDLSPEPRSQSSGPFPSGHHQFRVQVFDRAGNNASTPWIPMRIDGGAGVAATAVPTQMARGLTVIRYAPPNGFEPVEVRFVVDGQLRHATSVAPYEFVWNTRSYADGGHQIEIVGTAASGLEHRAFYAYEIRNSYAHVVADHAVVFGIALLLVLAAMVASTMGYVLWRRLPWV